MAEPPNEAEFIAVSGYRPKYAIHLLNATDAAAPARRGRVRPTIYDEAAKQALIVLWEASDRVCEGHRDLRQIASSGWRPTIS